jgi:membrane protease YdiL (CAAX protease family)
MVQKYLSYALHPERLKKFMDWLAYGSLVLDICITIITLSSIYYPLELESYLGHVNIVLSVVVVLSLISAAMIVGIRIYEEVLFRTFRIRNRIKRQSIRFRGLGFMTFVFELKRKIRRFFGKLH